MEHIAKERMISEFIPYRSMVDLNTVKTADNSYLRVIKLQGVPFESADDYNINGWCKQLNNLLKSIAGTEVAVWSHIVRRKTSLFPRGEFKNSFAKQFNEKYKAHINKESMLINELYLSIIFREKEEGAVTGIVDAVKGIFSKKTKNSILADQERAIEKLKQITAEVLNSLSEYKPELLGAYTLKKISKKVDGIESSYFSEEKIIDYSDYKPSDGHIYSELLEFLSYLLNSSVERVKMPNGEVHNYLPTSRIMWNDTVTMIENLKGEVFGSSLGITSYQDYTSPIMLDDLLDVDVEFILSQSLTFINRSSAMSKIKMQFDRMESTEDVGFSQQEELVNAMDDLKSHRFDMGNYSFSLFVKSDTLALLKENIAIVGSILMNNGLKWAVEDIAAQASYLSMLPANFKFRPRIAMITTHNFAGLAPLHGFPIGQYSGNQWGEAVTMFKTTAGSPYYFNFHSSDMKQDFDESLEDEFIEDVASNDESFDLANTIVAGQSGAGKTVLQGVLLAQCQKFDTPENPATFICTDSEKGMSITIKAMGGKFFDLSPENTRQTFNPFLLPYSISNVSFLLDLIKVMVEDNQYSISPSDEKLLTGEISRLLKMENVKVKRLHQLRNVLNTSESDGVYKRLEKWCVGGIHGWVFDNENDNFDVENQKLLCFEMSNFLENNEIRPAISMYFFHRLAEAMDKRRLIIFLDEFWQVLQDEYFSKKIKGLLKRIRKQNGFLVMFTQSPSDFIDSPISRTLIEQTSTQILLPNEKGKWEEYKTFGLSEAEFEVLMSLSKGSRRFLIRQNGASVLAELNLKGFTHELGVFSANTKTMEAVEKLENVFGEEPDKWLGHFYNYLDGKKVYFENKEVI